MAAKGDWETLSFVVTSVAFLLVLVALAGAGRDLHGMNGAVEALEIVGFLLLTGAFTMCTMVKYGQLEYNKELQITHVAVAYTAVVFIVVGLGIYGGKVSRTPPAYLTAILVTGALLAALGGTFSLLPLVEN